MSDASAGAQRELFILNRAVPELPTYARILELERESMVRHAANALRRAPVISTRDGLMAALDAQLEDERNDPPPSAVFLHKQASREQFRMVVCQFAVDGLTEAQSFFPIIGRLPIRAQMPMMRVFIDEFGCGHYQQAHSRLYMDLLEELELPVKVGAYLEGVNEESYAFVNMFYWMSQRASHPEYFLGALCYLENSIPDAFICFAEACHRLGIDKHTYYTEHLHIDGFHARETRLALRELDVAHGGLDYARAWVGMRMASDYIGQAVDAAVARAKTLDATESNPCPLD